MLVKRRVMADLPLLFDCRVVGGRGKGRAEDEWNASNVREIEVMGPETSPEDGAVEIVLNGKRALKRAGSVEPALVIAWPV